MSTEPLTEPERFVLSGVSEIIEELIDQNRVPRMVTKLRVLPTGDSLEL